MPISSWESPPRRNGTVVSSLADDHHRGDRRTMADPVSVQWLGASHAHGYAQP
jgi:hypothetical protein